MLIFGHIGVTIGIFFILGLLVRRDRSHIDYRYVAFGSLLPDIIDKPIGRVLFADSIANGRIMGHTLMFSFFLFLIGYYLYKSRGDVRISMISAASFYHLLEDQMWTQPTTLFWPIFGWDFPRGSSYGSGLDYLLTMFNRSLSLDFSHVFNFEFMGFVFIVFLIINSFRKK